MSNFAHTAGMPVIQTNLIAPEIVGTYILPANLWSKIGSFIRTGKVRRWYPAGDVWREPVFILDGKIICGPDHFKAMIAENVK